MYLIDTTSYALIHVEQDLDEKPEYAILSHRWVKHEIIYKTYQQALMNDPNFGKPGSDQEASVRKIRGACTVAKQRSLKYIWIDNCCIDKSSSEELRTALNSMFAWYHEAAICLTYLGDVTYSSSGNGTFSRDEVSGKKGHQPSEWFERGWTLQELLAPRSMQFYDRSWQPMGSRNSLADSVSNITGISRDYLQDRGSEALTFRSASIATRLSWMAGRTTRDVEDIAYSMLGILDVNMVPMYGEGAEAFSRLQETVMTSPHAFDESLFAWRLPVQGKLDCYRTSAVLESGALGLLAPSPDCFRRNMNGEEHEEICIQHKDVMRRLGNGFTKTHQGINFALPLKEMKSRMTGRDKKEISLPLNCWIGGNNVVLELVRDSGGFWRRTQGERLQPKKGAKVGDNKTFGIDQGSALLGQVTVMQPRLRLR
ncbi:hypothetical protein LTS14_004529 [Recurvomyces mirabilis]|nr:hypothetical protein LTS14_004529 [Recurvomyces mirabilis]